MAWKEIGLALLGLLIIGGLVYFFGWKKDNKNTTAKFNSTMNWDDYFKNKIL